MPRGAVKRLVNDDYKSSAEHEPYFSQNAHPSIGWGACPAVFSVVGQA